MDNENQPKINPIQDFGIIPLKRTSLSQGDRLEEALEKSRASSQGEMRTLKTYQSDVAEAIKKDNVSVIKIALAEKKRQEKEGLRQKIDSVESKKGLVFLILGVALIILGIGTLGFFYFSLKDNGDVVLLSTAKNFIYTEKSVEVNIDSKDFKSIPTSIVSLKQTPLSNASMENIVVTRKDRASSTIDISKLGQRKITAQEFMNLFNSRAPGSLVRSLSDPFMLGFYKDNLTTETFLILKTDSYENAFAGMLEWENNLERDMSALFSIPSLVPVPNVVTSSSGSSSSSSSSTIALQPIGPSAYAPKPFEDRLIENRDARILTDQNGKIVFLYSFLDPETLVFATSPNTFNEIVARTILAKHSK